MSLQIRYTNIDPTKAITHHVEKRVKILEKMAHRSQDIQDVRVEVGKQTLHHKQGPFYFAKIEAIIRGKLFVAETQNENLYLAVDEARNEIRREMKKFKEKRITLSRKLARRLKDHFRRIG